MSVEVSKTEGYACHGCHQECRHNRVWGDVPVPVCSVPEQMDFVLESRPPVDSVGVDREKVREILQEALSYAHTEPGECEEYIREAIAALTAKQTEAAAHLRDMRLGIGPTPPATLF